MMTHESSFLPEVADYSQHSAPRVFDSAVGNLPSYIACYSRDRGFADLNDGLGQATLPLASPEEYLIALRPCYGVAPSPVASAWQTARAGDGAVVAPQDILNVKIEDKTLELHTTSRLIAQNHLPTQAAEPDTNVDSLMRTIQLKSRRPPSYQASSSASSAPSPTSSASEIRAATIRQRDRPPHPCRINRKSYICSIQSCAKAFYQKAHLEIHVRAHTGYKPFVRGEIQLIG